MFMFNAESLRHYSILEDRGITKSGLELQLIIRLKINVIYNGNSYSIVVDIEEEVDQIKKKLKSKIGISSKQQTIILGEEEVQSREKLKKYSIKNDSSLIMHLKVSVSFRLLNMTTEGQYYTSATKISDLDINHSILKDGK